MGIKPSSLRCRHRLQLRGAAAAVSLPSDVIFEILSRTPVKSLCRFRCVSKEWRALISDPVFTAAHRRNDRSGGQPLLAVQFIDDPMLRLVGMDGRVVKVIDSYLGWVPLMSICNGTPDHVVCAITISNVARVIDLVTGKVLLETRLKGRIWGFGRAALSGAYKLLCLGHHICEVLTVDGEVDSTAGWRRKPSPPAYYTSSTVGEEDNVGWRRPPSPPTNYALFWHTGTATVNGTLHVLAEEEEEEDKRRRNIAVLCFDLESEVWKKEIKGPQDLHRHRGSTTDICELNGALCMIHTKVYGCTTDVWLLTNANEGTSWSKTYTVRRPDPSVHRWVMPLMMVVPTDDDDSGKLLFYYALQYARTSVPKFYDPRDGTCTDAMKMQDDYTEGIGLCSLPLECFVS